MGDDIEILPAAPSDAPALLELKLALDQETNFMMVEPGERTDTPDELARQLADAAATGAAVVLVAQRGGAGSGGAGSRGAGSGVPLLGYVEADRGAFRRNRHSAYVVIGVRREAAGQGIGGRLLDALDSWAREAGVHRLELTVRVDNDRAIGLYRGCGYETEGTRRGSLRVGGELVDELAMAKLL